MEKRNVSIFKPYSFYEGQKIQIDGGARNGDWEVVSFTKHKVKLRCPVSFKEFEWDRFCYQVEERYAAVWPQEEKPILILSVNGKFMSRIFRHFPSTDYSQFRGAPRGKP